MPRQFDLIRTAPGAFLSPGAVFCLELLDTIGNPSALALLLGCYRWISECWESKLHENRIRV